MPKQRQDFDYRRLFFRWLKDQGLYVRFYHNVNAAGNMYRLQVLNHCGATNYVGWCFCWRKSPEGHKFWLNVDYQW